MASSNSSPWLSGMMKYWTFPFLTTNGVAKPPRVLNFIDPSLTLTKTSTSFGFALPSTDDPNTFMSTILSLSTPLISPRSTPLTMSLIGSRALGNGICGFGTFSSIRPTSTPAPLPISFVAVLPRAETSSTAFPTSDLVDLLNAENLSTYCCPIPPGISFISLKGTNAFPAKSFAP